MIAAILRQNSALHNFYAVFSLPLVHYSTSWEAQSSLYHLLVHKHHFSPKSASQIADVSTQLRNPGRSASVLSFLEECGFSNSQLVETLKGKPELLSVNLEKYISPQIKMLLDLGVSLCDVPRIIARFPSLLTLSVNKRIVPTFSILNRYVGANGVGKLLMSSGWFFRTNLEKSLVPNIELLNKCGVPMNQIISMLYTHSRFLLRRADDMKKFVDKADEMGVPRCSRKFIIAVRVISEHLDETLEFKLNHLREAGFSKDVIASAFRKFPNVLSSRLDTLELKMKTLQQMGFSKDDMAAVLSQAPMVFSLSVETIKETIEVLLANGKYDLSCITSYPISLTYSVGKRYKPRLELLELLEGRNLIQSWPPLSTLCLTTDKKFYEKYAVPFVDKIGDLYTLKMAISG